MLLTRAQVREVDRRAIEEFGIPALVLMENAGREAARLLLSLGVHGPVVICCGKGNNGGDGLVIARHLAIANVPVQVFLLAREEDLTAETRAHWNIVRKMKLPAQTISANDEAVMAQELARAEWIVDALFGTGLTGPVRSPLDQVIHQINESTARVFAVDIPSGLDADTGQPLGATIASHTATFVAPKVGFTRAEAAPWLGKVHVMDIGVPRSLLETIPSPLAGEG